MFTFKYFFIKNKSRTFTSKSMPYDYKSKNMYGTRCILRINGHKYIITDKDIAKDNVFIIEKLNESNYEKYMYQLLKFYKVFPNKLSDETIIKIIDALSYDYFIPNNVKDLTNNRLLAIRNIIELTSKLKNKALLKHIQFHIKQCDVVYINFEIDYNKFPFQYNTSILINGTIITCNQNNLYKIIASIYEMLNREHIDDLETLEPMFDYYVDLREFIDYINKFDIEINTIKEHHRINKEYDISHNEVDKFSKIQDDIEWYMNFRPRRYIHGFEVDRFESMFRINFKSKNNLTMEIGFNHVDYRDIYNQAYTMYVKIFHDNGCENYKYSYKLNQHYDLLISRLSNNLARFYKCYSSFINTYDTNHDTILKTLGKIMDMSYYKNLF